MTLSATATWVMCIVIVLSLSAFLIAVALAARRPYFKNARRPPMTGPVQGGIHLSSGGRSVSPDVGEPATFRPDELKAEEALSNVPAQRGGAADKPEEAGAHRVGSG